MRDISAGTLPGCNASALTRFVAVLVLTCSSQSHAANAASWQVDTLVYLNVGAHLQEAGDTAARFGALSLNAELRLSQSGRHWSIGMFTDYQDALSTGIPAMLKTGLLLRRTNGDWDALGAIFRNDPEGRPRTWGYAGRLRYRLAEKHKIGVETFGSHRQLGSPRLLLGYYNDLSAMISLRVVAGTSLGGEHDRAGRLEIVWQVH